MHFHLLLCLDLFYGFFSSAFFFVFSASMCEPWHFFSSLSEHLVDSILTFSFSIYRSLLDLHDLIRSSLPVTSLHTSQQTVCSFYTGRESAAAFIQIVGYLPIFSSFFSHPFVHVFSIFHEFLRFPLFDATCRLFEPTPSL